MLGRLDVAVNREVHGVDQPARGIRRKRTRFARLPDDLDVVLPDYWISGHDWQALHLRLSDEQPVPRIAVDQRQGAGAQRVRLLDRQDTESVPSQQVRQVRPAWAGSSSRPVRAFMTISYSEPAPSSATVEPLPMTSRARGDSRAPPCDAHHRTTCVSSRTLTRQRRAAGRRDARRPGRTRPPARQSARG